jgi:hypothetical protein
MIEIVENILPISGAEWDVVASEHQKYYPDHDRTGDHLHTKFNALARTNVPTGDPNMPDHIREAKRVRRLIVDKTEGATGDEMQPLGPDDSVTDEEDLPRDLFGSEGGDVDGDGRSDAAAVAEGRGGAAVAGGGGALPVETPRVGGGINGITPITRRRDKHSADDMSFNQVMVLMANQQAAEARERDSLIRKKRGRRDVFDSKKRERRLMFKSPQRLKKMMRIKI